MLDINQILPENSSLYLKRYEDISHKVETVALSAKVSPSRLIFAMRSGDYLSIVQQAMQTEECPPEQLDELKLLTESIGCLQIYSHPQWIGDNIKPVFFGTGGFRALTGSHFKLMHVEAIIKGLIMHIESISPAQRLAIYGSKDLEEVKKKGFIVGHDNRLFNYEYSYFSCYNLRKAGYRARYVGRVATPEISYYVPLEGLAGGINFTASHNPWTYSGIKLCPADGGLMDDEVSRVIEGSANKILKETTPEQWHSPSDFKRIKSEYALEVHNIHSHYVEGLLNNPLLAIKDLAKDIPNMGKHDRIHIVVDPIFGGATTLYSHLQLVFGVSALTILNTSDDPYFEGLEPEPSRRSMEQIDGVLRSVVSSRCLVVVNDPDADRGMIVENGKPIPSYQFSALVLRYLYDAGLRGSIATTYPTSRFCPDYAATLGVKTIYRPVGFKNFRDLLRDHKVILAYEESDGLAIQGHTLDKDGIVVGLLATKIIAHYNKPLHELLEEVIAEVGDYYYSRLKIEFSGDKDNILSGLAVGAKIDDWPSITSIEHLGGGIQVALEGGEWFYVRPSGTEPGVRIYAESRQGIEQSEALCQLAQTLLNKG